MLYLIPALFAFGATLILTLLALKFFPKWGLLDRPQKYGLKRKPIPYYGGLIIFVVFFVAVLLFVKLDSRLLGLLLGSLLIVGVSFADDMFSFSLYLRLVIQILAALILVFAGVGISSISNPFGGPIVLDQQQISFQLADWVFKFSVLGALFTLVWVVGMVNTMNFLDGLNGLPSGVSAIAALTILM